jgi:DNA topoisomerase-1
VSKPLLIVESPTKVKTLRKYLGDQYAIAATVGHIRDLPEKEMGIDVEDGFKAKYSTIPGKQKVITALKQAAGETDLVYLAPDPDREGEAIAWHTAEILKKKGRIFQRVLFHELTQNAILKAMASPLELDRNKFEAQQARRILDRLVGYQISPLLWRKVKGGLSAGRVQSVAVRMICERERAIQAFVTEEYWSITANLEGSQPPVFSAKLAKHEGKKIKIPDETNAMRVRDELSLQQFVIESIVNKTTRRNPLPPFITSKLQQEAIRKLRFSAKKTMSIAQELYEGIELGSGGPIGLITYMRTDSTRISEEAATEALTLIQERFGKEYALSKPRYFKNTKKVQDAHEAIRPASVFVTPEQTAPFLSKDQQALYTLIWKRFVASQMTEALIDTCTITIQAGTYQLTATGSVIKFPGFMALYLSADDEADNESDPAKARLPVLSKGEILVLKELLPKQHFTQPPPRFSEASLVKALEENGIGRPSTYAAILTTIRGKAYVELEKGFFIPSELGFIVNDLIVDSFPEVFDIEFTARMEDNLDRIETAEAASLEILTRFYEPFKQRLDNASTQMISMKGVGRVTDLDCTACKTRKLHIKMGKNGHFLACSGYPDCKFTSNYTRDEKGRIQTVEPPPEAATDQVCGKCGQSMVLRQGKFGPFLACSGYPDCKNTQSVTVAGSPQETGVSCPESGCTGMLVQKMSKRGKVFYGCNRYPDCTFAIWDKPINQECPLCHAKFLVEKMSKKEGVFLACLNKDCGYKTSGSDTRE